MVYCPDDKGAYESAQNTLNGNAGTLLVKNARNYPKGCRTKTAQQVIDFPSEAYK